MRAIPSLRAPLELVRYRFWKVVHNVIAHPLLEVLPERHGTALHDWTARRMEHPTDAVRDVSPDPVIRKLVTDLSPEALAFLGRHRGPVTVDVLRTAVAITRRELN